LKLNGNVADVADVANSGASWDGRVIRVNLLVLYGLEAVLFFPPLERRVCYICYTCYIPIGIIKEFRCRKDVSRNFAA
jgi:hypothetical protein